MPFHTARGYPPLHTQRPYIRSTVACIHSVRKLYFPTYSSPLPPRPASMDAHLAYPVRSPNRLKCHKSFPTDWLTRSGPGASTHRRVLQASRMPRANRTTSPQASCKPRAKCMHPLQALCMPGARACVKILLAGFFYVFAKYFLVGTSGLPGRPGYPALRPRTAL